MRMQLAGRRGRRPNSNFVSARMIPRPRRDGRRVAGTGASAWSRIASASGRRAPARQRPRRCARSCRRSDVLVVLAALGLGRGREDRLRQPVALAQAGRQRDAADRARSPVVLPAASRRGSRGRSASTGSDARPGGRSSSGRAARRAVAGDVVGQRPPGRSPSRWFGDDRRRSRRTRTATGRSGPGPCPGSAVGRTTSNALIAVRRDEQQPLVVERVQVADLARADEPVSGEHRAIPLDVPTDASQRVEPRDDLGDVAQERRVVEAGVELRRATARWATAGSTASRSRSGARSSAARSDARWTIA